MKKRRTRSSTSSKQRDALRLLVLCLWLCISHRATAQDIQEMADAMSNFVSESGFMGSVVVVKDDIPIFSEGYGYANLEWKINNAPSTKFRIASITKQFTAVAILLLEERGELNVDAPVGDYVSDAPDSWSEITLFHLLTHSSGLPANLSDTPRNPLTPREVLRLIADEPLLFAPGEGRSYSNLGYFVLGLIVELVTGQTYGQYLEENLFIPLEMFDTGLDSSTKVLERRAQGYEEDSEKNFVHGPDVNMSIVYAAGGLYSTAEDMARWNSALFSKQLVVSSESLEKMLTPYGELPPFGLTGFGTIVSDSVYGPRYGNGGGLRGAFTSSTSFFPDSNVSVIVLSNFMDFDLTIEVAGKLAELAHRK